MARRRALAALALGVWSAGFVNPIGVPRAISQTRQSSSARRPPLRTGAAACLAAGTLGLSAALVLRRSPGVAREFMGGGSSKEVQGDSIYDFTVKNIDGQDVSLNEYNGKVALIVNLASK
mmetsp:Transcript_21348/g.40177  ORF Transcript_21348/g.40177 Transcript_21348/m.40177 type:complete len:120 (-) Transcript_21348:638-997(-)